MLTPESNGIKPIRIFAERVDYRPEERAYLHPVLKSLWNDRTASEREQVYGVRPQRFQEVDSPEAADAHLLTMVWNYYVDRQDFAGVDAAVSRAQYFGKPLLALCRGDSPASIPYPGITMFESSPHRSRQRLPGTRVFGYPAFISDYVDLYCDGRLQIRQKGPLPIVGFCGYAGGNQLDFLGRKLKNQLRWLAYRTGFKDWEPPLVEPTSLRHRVLTRLADSGLIQTDFVMRREYRAGYQPADGDKDPFHPTRLEYVNNILNSDYTVCIRGGGNFSVRFYETLCLGRIPVFVDTDCVLPYDHMIDYRQHAVWVDQSEIPHITEKVLEFHQSLSASDFEQLQVANRQLWLEYLSHDGFYNHFNRHFDALA